MSIPGLNKSCNYAGVVLSKGDLRLEDDYKLHIFIIKSVFVVGKKGPWPHHI